MAIPFIHFYYTAKNTEVTLEKLLDPFSLYLPQWPPNYSNARKVGLLSLPESISNKEHWNVGKKADTICFKRSPFFAFEDWDPRVLCMALSHKSLNTAVWVSPSAVANSSTEAENVKVHRGTFSCYDLNTFDFSLMKILKMCVGYTSYLLGFLLWMLMGLQ